MRLPSFCHLSALWRRFSSPPHALPALWRRFSRPSYPMLVGSLCALIVLTLLAGFVPGRLGGILRLPLSLAPPPLPEYADRRPLDTTTWKLRRPISAQPVVSQPVFDDAGEDGLLRFAADGVSILTTEGPRRVRPDASGAAEGDLYRLLRQSQDAPSGLSLATVIPAKDWAAALCVPSAISEMARAKALRRAWREESVSPYSFTIGVYATKFGLDRRLIYAIMHTESGFDPSSISNRGAHGLMQIVPDSAGYEVHTYLHGVAGRPDTAALLNPFTNIQYGVTYLHLLLRRHMAGVKDPLSREYCAVAAYNIGPGAVLKVFGATRAKAFEAINALTPAELYADLLKRLPAAETRAFLRKVMLVKSDLTLADAAAARAAP
ncbi:MAG: transglycosylase SLT domain-containing protein [Deltaproteobacteria bacterium]|nr:transglycosylase SLT domain-containing protein [Deltaproteobacteria bacterium]